MWLIVGSGGGGGRGGGWVFELSIIKLDFYVFFCLVKVFLFGCKVRLCLVLNFVNVICVCLFLM